jgi:hypothetical protein
VLEDWEVALLGFDGCGICAADTAPTRANARRWSTGFRIRRKQRPVAAAPMLARRVISLCRRLLVLGDTDGMRFYRAICAIPRNPPSALPRWIFPTACMAAGVIAFLTPRSASPTSHATSAPRPTFRRIAAAMLPMAGTFAQQSGALSQVIDLLPLRQAFAARNIARRRRY